VKVAIGLGANLEGRLATIRTAVARLRAVAKVEAVSRVYESDPVGPPQPRYLNAAVRITWEGSAHDLLDALQSIEAELGRERSERWGPRTIDLDILWIEGMTIDDARLVVPHPRLRERAFAVVPLLELVPGAVDPRTGEVYEVPPEQQLVRVADEIE
jgi:2-amino-4-hydroxy-6-hydroxymethyldihydropteridine diphosphokinase